ncbi:universal stress protein [Streptomyces naphthomycinicus]|uniref:universal stress protein n=1 Tax=Streptomyces naphthomycinicus TaxID=2872625 RepID=UPI001CED8673|nr:universal stress protein [Streptomyces sp. TML10]
MELPIVVGVDGSEPSLGAVDWGADEAALRGAQLRLVYASLWEHFGGDRLAHEHGKPPEEVTAGDIVDTAERRAHRRQPGVKVTTEVLPEAPECSLVRESQNAFAVVVGSRGRNGITEALLGSVAVMVAGHAYCPVIVLRGGQDDRAGTETRGRIVLGVAENPADSAAFWFAAEEAALRGVPLEAVRAWRRPARAAGTHPPAAGAPAHEAEQQATEVLDEVCRRAPAGLRVRRRAVEDRARDALLAASRDAALLVVGARRRHGDFGLQLGRVAHGLLHQAACPVAVVPERD